MLTGDINLISLDTDGDVANLKRMIDIVNAEISGTKRLLSSCEGSGNYEK